MAQPDKQEPIAIVGAACRFAGEATSLDSLWDMISKVKTGYCEVPADRWHGDNWWHPDPDRKGAISSKHGYFLKQDISHLDAPFFSITAKEAAAMDPMKRMLLEVTYESIENAGIHVDDLMNSRTGVYVGCMTNDYEMTSLHDIYDIGHPAATGLSEAMTANRISWFFGLKGPSLTLDTACSSSLYALHLACQSLRLKETNMSLVSGVNLMINPNTSHQMTAMHMLSHEGISHTFDDRANGYGRGDGIGSIIVKRLSDAIRDGDTIRAVIRGSGVNADGKTPSITQPSSVAQAEMIRQTYEDAGLDMNDTGYFECHGTGTPVGDPLEVTAIADTLGKARREAGKPPLHIGSIKPTIGHTEGCAGLAGVFKSIMMLEKGMLAPTYGVERINPKLKFEEWHLALPQQVSMWPTQGLRRISVNSFGFGGANAHMILDDAYHYMKERNLPGKHNTTLYDNSLPPQSDVNLLNAHIILDNYDGTRERPASDSGVDDVSSAGSDQDSSKKQLFLLSGKDQTSTQRVSQALTTYLEENSKGARSASLLEDLAYTLALRRTPLEHRTFAIASSLPELTEKLSKGLPAATRSQRNAENLVMVFTGQGAQWPAMGRELFDHPVFRKSLEASQSYLEAQGCTWSAIEELTKTPNPNIDRPDYSQPLCTVVQVALVDLLRFWKIMPTATIGHSSGEIGAAYAASHLTHRDAIKLAFVRGVVSASVSKKGAMMAAGLSQDEAQVYLENVPFGTAVVACVNSPSSVTISGDVDSINQLETLISSHGKFARKLKVTTAYHSPHMKEVGSKYLEMIGQITPKEVDDTGNSPVMYSSLTGSLVTSSKELDAQYWVNNMENAVQFSQGILALLKHKKVAPGGTRPAAVQWGGFLEVGPHAALQGPLRQIIDASKNKFAKSAPYASMLIRGKDATETSISAAGTLWSAGYKVDMNAVNQHDTVNTPHQLCDLPRYPWNHTRSFWHESYSSKSYRFPTHVRNDYLGWPEDSQSSHEPRWKNYLRVSENPWIEDHVITGTVLYPGAGMLVMALEGVLRTADPSKKVEGFKMSDVSFERGLVISLDEESPLQTNISFHPHLTKSGAWSFTVFSMTKGPPWVKHCTGTIELVYEKEASQVEDGGVDAMWQRQSDAHKALQSKTDSATVDVVDFYNNLENIGMQYGPTFRNVTTLTAVPSSDASYGTVAVPDTKSTMPKHFESPHVIHPATLDSIFHLVIASLDAGKPAKQAAVPYHIDEIYIAREQPQGAGALYSGYGRTLSHHGHEINTELFVSNEQWEKPMLTIKNFALRQVTSGGDLDAAAGSSGSTKNCAEISWVADPAFLSSNDDIAKLVPSSGKATKMVDAFLDSVFLKKSNSTVLVAMFDESETSVELLQRLRSREYGPKNINAFSTTESGLQLMRATLGEGTQDVSIAYKSVPESELHETLAPEGTDLVMGLGLPNVAKHADALARLAPLACLTHAGQPGDVGAEMVHRKSVGRLAEDGTYVLFTSSMTVPPSEVPDSVALLLPASPSDALNTFASNIQTKLEGSGVSVEQANLTQDGITSLNTKTVISLLEIDGPLVYSWEEEQFQAFKQLVSKVGHLFWITHGSVLEAWSNGVEYATSQGLFRVMRNEYPIAVLPTMDLSATADITSDNFAELVLNVWQTSLPEDAEMEYAEGNGLIYLPRAVEAADYDYELQLADKSAKPIMSTLGAPGKALKASESANDQACIWIPDEEAESALEANEVEIKTEFAGLGDGKADDSLHHAVGVVSRRGDSVKAVETGQRVIMVSQSAAKTHVRQNQTLVTPLPSGLEPQDAVALVEPLITAQYALVETAHLAQGQTLLVDNAASAVGQALIQVAKATGADIFALVHSRAERDILAGQYGIPASNIFDSSLSNFVPLIQDATQSHGVDVVVSQESGAHIAGVMSILNDFGQFIDLNTDGSSVVLPTSKTNVTLARINMPAVMQGRPNVVSKLFQKGFSEYQLQGPSPLAVLPVTNLSPSVKHVQTEQIVMSLSDETPVLMNAPPSEELKLDSEKTYVLAGGLGVLGLDIANWMVDFGAKNLVFLSRSGGAKNQKDLEKFAERGVRAEAFACNVNDAASVAKVFDTLKADGRKVGGVIQMAMVLQDGIFDNMSYSQWRGALQPKTRGSRNLLSNMWPGDNAFFILLSSITGVIGNTAQANYASGNTFEDGLAHHARTHLGIAATSIDVGLVTDSSHFTDAGEFGDLAGYLGRYQHGWRGLQTDQVQLGVVMRAIMRGSTPTRKGAPAQVVLGLGDRCEQSDLPDKKFELRVVKSAGQSGDGEGKQDIGTLLSSATTMAEAATAVEDSIKDLVAATMGIAVEEVDGQKPLYDYGVDSLQAVEIRNRALKNMKSDISVFDIMSTMPLADVAAQIATKSELVKVTATEE